MRQKTFRPLSVKLQEVCQKDFGAFVKLQTQQKAFRPLSVKLQGVC